MVSRSLGAEAPPGKDVFEIYVRTKSNPGVLGRLANLMKGENVGILWSTMQVSTEGFADHLFYVEMADSRIGVEEFVELMKQKAFVLEVRMESKKRIMYENMLFPLTISRGDARLFVIRDQAWASILKRIVEVLGSGGKMLLHEEGIAFGESVVKLIQMRMGEQCDRETMIENLKANLNATGKGILTICERGQTLEVSIGEPTIADCSNELDHLLVGIVVGALQKIFSAKYSVNDLVYEDRKIRFALLPLLAKEIVA